MAKLVFERNEDEYITEAKKIELTFDEDIDIYEFHTLCIRLAGAVGFHHNSIERAFGKIHDYPNPFDNEVESFV